MKYFNSFNARCSDIWHMTAAAAIYRQILDFESSKHNHLVKPHPIIYMALKQLQIVISLQTTLVLDFAILRASSRSFRNLHRDISSSSVYTMVPISCHPPCSSYKIKYYFQTPPKVLIDRTKVSFGCKMFQVSTSRQVGSPVNSLARTGFNIRSSQLNISLT
jgi:hypothetical protein